MVCVELTENYGAEVPLSTASNMQGRAWYFATLPPLSATLQALSLGTGTPVIPALSLIWALRVSSALSFRFDGEKQRGARKKFGSMEGLTTANSAGLFFWGGVSFLCPSRVLSTPFLFSSDISYLRSVCNCHLHHRETDSLTQVARAEPLSSSSRRQAPVHSCSLLPRQLHNGLDILESSEFSVGF